MNKNKMSSLLVNAESFGFGPTSAIADCFYPLREKFEYLAYVGSSHSLDLQTSLPYNHIYRLESNSTVIDQSFKDITKEFSGFFTALDFRCAELAIEMGLPCVIYDPLTWFWRDLPPILTHPNVLYLAQEFHGVQDTLQKKKEYFKNFVVVPPLVKKNNSSDEKTLILVNLGGLMNPFWSLDDCVHYADCVVEAVSSSFLESGDEIIILGNQHLEKALPHRKIVVGSRSETKKLLPKAKLAISTPGLGNIYESAGYGIPTLFLPPPGNSHGQQLEILIEHDEVDEYIDWQDLDGSLFVDYHAAQPQVMQKLSSNIKELNASSKLQSRLHLLIKEKCILLAKNKSSKTSRLLDQFGDSGANVIAPLIYNFIHSNRSI